MNAQSKKLTQLAASIILAMAVGNALADNVITFEGALKNGVTNGANNTGNIDANGATDATVNIRQISGEAAADYDVTDATVMNQVGVYIAGIESPLDINGTNTVVKIGQGVKFQDSPNQDSFDSATEAGSVNNLVKGTIGTALSTATKVYISQTGAAGADSDAKAGTLGRLVNLTAMEGGTLRINQTAGAETVDVTSMTLGELTINQSGDGQKATITSFDGGTTILNQGALATNSTLNLTNETANAGQYGDVDGVTINQTGAFQTTTVSYVNSGYNGTLNLEAHGATGTPNVYTTLDIKL